MDAACYDLIEKRITRAEAFELVKKFDGKCEDKYIQKFCDYIEISMDEFWKVVNEFRGSIWKKNENNEWHNTYWDLADKN